MWTAYFYNRIHALTHTVAWNKGRQILLGRLKKIYFKLTRPKNLVRVISVGHYFNK